MPNGLENNRCRVSVLFWWLALVLPTLVPISAQATHSDYAKATKV